MTISPEHVRLLRWLAAGLGSGWLPKTPGTWGSLAAWLPGIGLAVYGGAAALLLAALLVLALGCLVCARLLPLLGDDDPGWIVIDEWAGLWLAMALVAAFADVSWLHMALALAAFRLFDILKPFPIRRIEHLGPAWWSIMADDLFAGLMGGTLVLIILAAGG